jgi:ankyrin repeat protein
MFRVENGREIPWGHEKQIFQGLKQAHAENISNDNNNIAWQIALCYHLGFGTPRSAESALHYAEIAKAESHPVAAAFSGLLGPRNKVTEDPGQAKYALRISRLLHLTPLSQEMPPLVKACFDGVSERVLSLLSDGEPPNSATTDGCTMFHWLFMLEDSTALGSVVETLRSSGVTCRLLPDAHFNSVREAHSQWPLQLCGSPLSLAIAVNSLDAVKALLSLGADPTRYVYSSGQFPSSDPRTTWTAFHMAAKYHSPEILRELLKHVKASELKTMGPPLACALSFSTTLERFAMHGTNHPQQLERTIAAIREIQPLSSPGGNGMTPLMQAIDFQDHEVVTVLLRAEPELAKTPLRSLRDSSAFTLPIHFAAQIAARRDDPGTLSIPQLINSYSHDLSPSAPPPRDDQARTPLHLAVTGTSSLVTEWILQERKGLIHVEDFFGRTPLHCCASVATLTATLGTLLEQGASIDHTDRYGMTTLHRACCRGQVELVRALLKHNPKLDLRNNPYGTPLHCAIVAGSMDVVLVLLDAGASPNARDKRGNTPVHVAARLNRLTILRILIKREADVTLRNENGRDARNIATAAGRLGNIGALSILQQGWERVATQKILDIDPAEHRRNFGFVGGNPKKENLPPDFLWTSNLDGRALVQELGENSEVGHDGATAAEDAGDEKDGSFDARESRMARYSDVCESIRLAHYSFAGQRHWLVTETMALVWVFFEDDVLWQPPLTVQAMEIITRIAYDLCHILRNASAETQVQVKEQLRAKPERPDALREQIQLLPARQATGSTTIAIGTERLPVGSLGLPIPEIAVLDDDIRVLEAAAHDTRGFPEMPAELEAERKSVDCQSSIGLNTPEEAEAKSKFDGNAVEDQRKEERLRESQVPQRGENEQPPAPDFEAQAAGHIANLVVETKPSSAFPGRSLADLEELILWQLRRMPRSETLSQHGGYYFRSSVFDLFPRLKRKPNQYLRWKDAREAAARSQSQAARATTGWIFRNANPIWNFI